MKKRVAFIAPLLGFLMSPALARGQSPTTSTGKVGVINIQEAILSTAEGKKAMGDLQKKYQPRQAELQRLQQDIQALNDQLQKQSTTLSDDEQRRLSRELEEKQKLFKRQSEDFNTDAGADRDEAIRRIGQKMVGVIKDYAQQNGYALVVDGAQIPVYYASTDIELTDLIVKRYDAANPVADAQGAAPDTPANRPAASNPRPAVSTNPKPGDKPKP
jgi:outer membrane protein